MVHYPKCIMNVENINMKEITKKLGKKFACGASCNPEDFAVEL